MDLPLLFCRGTHYEVGFQMGNNFKEKIQQYYRLFDDLHKSFLPFYHSAKGKKICDDYLEIILHSFPQYVDEMRGISAGAELPFEQVLLMHLRVELQAYLNKKEAVPECSTVFLNTDKMCSLSHNEDTSVLVRGRGYLVSLHIAEPQKRGKHNISEEKFVSFCYPGVVPGNSMNFNSHGLVLTVNALYPSLLKLNQTPRQIINRAMLSAMNMEMLREVLKDSGDGIATGCSINAAYISENGNRIMSNFELAPSKDKKESIISEYPVVMVNSGYYNHFNMYKHLSVPEMKDRTISSIHRQKRADELPVPVDIKGIFLILGDTKDSEYPIYRTPRRSDPGDTVATGVFDFMNSKLSVYTGNPKEVEPVAELQLPFHV